VIVNLLKNLAICRDDIDHECFNPGYVVIAMKFQLRSRLHQINRSGFALNVFMSNDVPIFGEVVSQSSCRIGTAFGQEMTSKDTNVRQGTRARASEMGRPGYYICFVSLGVGVI
jgi:hypothetical protein